MDTRFYFAFYCSPSGVRSRHSQAPRKTISSLLGRWNHPRYRVTKMCRVLFLAGLNEQSEQTCSRKRWFPTKRKGGRQ